MTRRPDPARALRQLARHGRTPTVIPLRDLTATDLVHIATTRPGGPAPEHTAEAERRIREAPPFTAVALSLTFLPLTGRATDAQGDAARTIAKRVLDLAVSSRPGSST